MLQNPECKDLAEDQSMEETLQRHSISGKHTIGKLTSMTLSPCRTIPVNYAGFEDVNAFWEAAKSPDPNSGKQSSSREFLEEEEECNQQQELNKCDSKNPPELLTQQEEYGRPDGIATPQNTWWSNRLLHKLLLSTFSDYQLGGDRSDGLGWFIYPNDRLK
jgi:hypothetical protein